MAGTVHAERASWVVCVREHHVTLIPVTMALHVCSILMMESMYVCVLMEDMGWIVQKVVNINGHY